MTKKKTFEETGQARYTPELAAKICKLVSDGLTVAEVSRMNGMPHRSSIKRWAQRIPTFAKLWKFTKECQLEAWHDEMIEIADDGRNDWIERQNKRSGETYVALNQEAISRAQLRCEVRKFAIAKRHPDYSDKVSVKQEVTGANGGPVQTITTEMSAKEAAELYAALIKGDD